MPDSSVSWRHRFGPAVMVAVAGAYCLIAATTTPFTTSADVVAGLPIVAMAVAVLARWPLRTGLNRSPAPASNAVATHPYRPWVAFVAVLAAWELFNYLVHGSRANHPTFSSITDAIDRFYLLKVLLFGAWLSVLWLVVRRGTRRVVSGLPRQGAL